MKKIILLLVALILLGVLVVVYIPFTPAEPVVGADRDAHGCIASAGYTYSVVRGDCIRLWEQGIALTPTVQIGSPALAAYVVHSDDGTQAEVFLPDFNQGLILNRVEAADTPTWAAPGGWELTYDPDEGWNLLQDGQRLYTTQAE